MLYVKKPTGGGSIEYVDSNGKSIFKIDDSGGVRAGVGSRLCLDWIAGQRGKPALNADLEPASADDASDGATKAEFALLMQADPDFEILGTSAASTCSAFNAEGGIKFTTTGTTADQVILWPHQDASQSVWGQVTWGTDQQTRWEAIIKTGSAITAQVLWAGLKLTNTPTIITDADQVYFRYEDGVADGKWVCVTSIGDTDTSTNSVDVAINTVYHFVVDIDSSRIAKVYLNGSLIKTTTALTDAVDLIPFIGIQTAAAVAKHVIVRSQSISRVFA